MESIMLTSAETTACQRLITLAIEEDLSSEGDLTSLLTIPIDRQGKAVFVARSGGVLAGLPIVPLVCGEVEQHLSFQPLQKDGAPLQRGTPLATISGPMRGILAAERTALNFLQRLSGIASLTRRYVDAVAGLPARILDTRKTTPGYRLLEKYAVRCGGGHNLRMGLYDGILVKDNHLAALGNGPETITKALENIRSQVGDKMPIEIEVETLEQLDLALNGKPAIILLDNMSLDMMQEAVRRRNESSPGVQLEASGGVNLDTVRAIAETGVDRISVGALTHSASALDIALDYQK
jgi:nicotinate-nucleotide pyrophosphorylase (carboxylating)